MRAKPICDGNTVWIPNERGEMEDIGPLTRFVNLKRLIELKAFIYEEGGRISVRLESKQRGSANGYWVAYKRTGGTLHKTYVCQAELLDADSLHYAAQRLL